MLSFRWALKRINGLIQQRILKKYAFDCENMSTKNRYIWSIGQKSLTKKFAQGPTKAQTAADIYVYIYMCIILILLA